MIQNPRQRGAPAERLAELEAMAWDLMDRVRSAEGDGKELERGAKILLAAISRLQSIIALDLRLAERSRKHAKPLSPLLSEEWQQTKERLLTALEPFPEARNAVVEALRDKN